MEMLIKSILGFDQLAFPEARLLEGSIFKRLGARKCRAILGPVGKRFRSAFP
jgi:hypothetical protein